MTDKFTSPYADDIPMSQPSIDISVDDLQLLRGATGSRGSIQFTIQRLVHCLCYELRRRQITDYTKADDFRTVVGELTDPAAGYFSRATTAILSQRKSSVGQQSAMHTYSETSHGDDGRGTENVGGIPPKPADVVPVPPSSPNQRSGTGRSGGAKKKVTKSSKVG